jgi:GNAT superfamily N-acetyltransferase
MRLTLLFLLLFVANGIFAGHELVPIAKQDGGQILPSLKQGLLQPSVIYPAGVLRVDDNHFRVSVSRIPKKMGDGHMDWYNLFFRGPNKTVCSITFFIEGHDAIFKGIFIDENWRRQGLMKPFIKYWTLLARHHGYNLQTAKLYKPLFTKVFKDFFFKPLTENYRVRIYQDDESGQVRVHPFGFLFRRSLLASQNMVEVEESEDPGQDVHVYTSYLLAPDSESAFLQRIDPIRGDYLVFVRFED